MSVLSILNMQHLFHSALDLLNTRSSQAREHGLGTISDHINFYAAKMFSIDSVEVAGWKQARMYSIWWRSAFGKTAGKYVRACLRGSIYLLYLCIHVVASLERAHTEVCAKVF